MRPVLESDRLRVEIDPEHGGRLTSLRYSRDDHSDIELLVQQARRGIHSRSIGWGCYPMAPWPGRVGRASFEWKGKRVRLEANERDSAMHGLVFDRKWSIASLSERTVRLVCELPDSWPWRGRVHHVISVEGSRLELEIEITSDRDDFPAGVGWHPWFLRRERDVTLRLDADGVYPVDDQLIPLGRPLAPEGELDFYGGRRLGERRVDHVYSGVKSPIVVDWSDLRLEIANSDNLDHACIYTPLDTFCVEPQSCSADAFNLSRRGIETGLAIVSPDAPLVAKSTWNSVTVQ